MDSSNFTPEVITLDFYSKSGDSFGVTWQTKEEGKPILEYTDEDDLNFEHPVRVKGECSEGMKAKKNCAVITGIAPGQRCRWRVGDECGVRSADAVFTVPPTGGDKLDFLVFADSQDEDNNGLWWKCACKDAIGHFPGTRLFAHAGDIVQFSGSHEMWRDMIGNNEEFVSAYPMLPSAGNHDYWHCYLDGYSSTLYSHFNIDLAPQDTSHGIYYSVDIGPVHFTVLSSGDLMETNDKLLPTQVEWLVNDLAAADRAWTIVMIHNPLYSPGKYGARRPVCNAALSLRKQLNGIFAAYGVDMVLCGHDHVLGKSYPIRANSTVQTDFEYVTEKIGGTDAKIMIDPAGPIHFEPGCCGNQNREIEDLTEDFASELEVSESMHDRAVAYAHISIDGDTLCLTFREVSVDDGADVSEFSFGIRKTKKM